MLRNIKPFSGGSVSSHQTRPCRNKHSLIASLCDQPSQNQTCPSCTLMVPWINMSLLKSKWFLDAVDVDNKCTTNVATVVINIHYTHTAYQTLLLVQLPNPIQSINLMPQQHLEAAIIIPVINNSLKCHLWNFCFISILQIFCKLSQMLKNLQRMGFVQSDQRLTMKGTGWEVKALWGIEGQEKDPSVYRGSRMFTCLWQWYLYMHKCGRALGTQGEVGAAALACYLPALCEL